MYCSVYKSLKKEQTYLYIEKKGDFSQVPEPLKALMGAMELVMVVPKRPAKDFALVSRDTIEKAFADDGYWLQLPPPPVNYLQQHRSNQKQQQQSKDRE